MNQSLEKKLRSFLESYNKLFALKEMLDVVLETNYSDEIRKLLLTTRRQVWEKFSAEQEKKLNSVSLDKSPKSKDQSAIP